MRRPDANHNLGGRRADGQHTCKNQSYASSENHSPHSFSVSTATQNCPENMTRARVWPYVRRSNRLMLTGKLRSHEPAHPFPRRDRAPPDQLGCAELAQSAPQLVLTNLAVAAAMLNPFYSWLTGQLEYEVLFLDISKREDDPVRRAVVGSGCNVPHAD
jgi:hypothetical protein